MARVSSHISAVSVTVMLFLTASSSWAEEVQTEIINEARSVLYFDAPDAALSKLLPAGWTLTPIGAGPFKGADLALVFIDRTLATDPDGKALTSGAVNRLVVLAILANDGGAVPPVPFILPVGYGADPAAVPSYYQNFVHAAVKLTRMEESGDGVSKTISERWELSGPDDAKITFSFKAPAGVPVYSPFSQRVVSGADPGRYRFYRGNQGTDMLMSADLGINTTEELSFSASGKLLSDVFDGSEKVVGVVRLPWYHRETFIPATN